MSKNRECGRIYYAYKLEGVVDDRTEVMLVRDIVETGASVGLMLTAPFGQGDEYEADSKGREYAKKAGYDTKAGLEVLRRFKKDEGEYDDLEKMFRSHPFSEERISRLEK